MKGLLTSFLSLPYFLSVWKCLKNTLGVNCVTGKNTVFEKNSCYFLWPNAIDFIPRGRCICDEIFILIFWNTETVFSQFKDGTA